MVFEKTSDLVGNTPLVRLVNIESEFRLNAKIYAKVEYFNPAGSVKDRIGLAMIVDAFIAGIGTGGTVSGVGKYLKERNGNIKIVGVEPETSPLPSKGVAGPNEKAFEFSRLVGKKEGMLVGISSGAALFAAIELAKREEMVGKTIVVLFPDTGDRYLSTPLFE